MNLPRIIPVLSLSGDGLVKTVRFSEPTYIGDPINTVKIFNEKEVDEIVLLDIEATRKNKEPDFKNLERITQEAFMPIGYGGGIHHLRQAEMVFKVGFEKVIICSAFVENPVLVRQVADKFGSQSVVVCIDVKKTLFGKNASYYDHGTKKSAMTILEHAKKSQEMGAGEIILHSIDRDGTMAGYDLALLREVSRSLTIPVVALGGAGSLQDLRSAVADGGASAAAAGSLFVYQGKLKGILIQYPDRKKLKETFA